MRRKYSGKTSRKSPRRSRKTAAASANGSVDTDSPSAESEDGEQPQRRIIQNDEDVEPLDLGAASYGAILKRAIPVAAVIVALIVVFGILRRQADD